MVVETVCSGSTAERVFGAFNGVSRRAGAGSENMKLTGRAFSLGEDSEFPDGVSYGVVMI